MSGHSKWHTIKHKKGAADAKRGKIFTRIIKELTVAARGGGGDPDTNPRLRTIIAEAKSVNMPADNIKRAIQRGTGELPGVVYEEITYEGYGPGGAAVIIETLTDNKNRTVGEMRHMLGKYGGNLGAENSVAWMFDTQGLHRRREGEGRRRHADGARPSKPAPTTCATMATAGKIAVGAGRVSEGARGGEGARHRAGSRRARDRCRRTTSSSKASRRSRWSS